MEIKTNDYRVWADGNTIYYEGTMRLSSPEDYAPIQALMKQVLEAAEANAGRVDLDLMGLEFLNSSGINLFAKFTIEVRNRGGVGLGVRGTARIPWHAKSLPNLKKLFPALDLQIL
ncbi:MAG: hypothetical protein LM550_04180 [Candidatus Contendobacter sp.]|nr:hypothetical protein [Gammaproteobacteria bacterium]MCC8992881.1 hypothetical protein [Candidatus Contendobacter sp.]